MAEELETGEDIQDRFDQITEFVEQNQKVVFGVAAVIAVVIIGVVYFFLKYIPDENLKAQKEIHMAQFAFQHDSFDLALNGRPISANGAKVTGFKEIAQKFSWTKTGNLANYYAGICCLQTKKYTEAISYLDKFTSSDPIIGALKLSATGDAYAENNNLEEGAKYYEKAANFSDNEGYTPFFLLKAGMANEKLKKYAYAKKLYEKIRDQYPKSEEGRQIEKYIARAGAAAGN